MVFTDGDVAWRVYNALKGYYDTFIMFRPKTHYRICKLIVCGNTWLRVRSTGETFDWDGLLRLALLNDRHFQHQTPYEVLYTLRETPLLRSEWERKWSSRLIRWHSTEYDLPSNDDRFSEIDSYFQNDENVHDIDYISTVFPCIGPYQK